MPIRIVRLGSPRAKDEGLRIGTVRRPPRGVPKAEFSKRNYYDVWLPELAPQPETVASAIHGEQSPAAWKKFVARYVREMSAPAPKHMIGVLAALSHTTNLSVGCYCEDEARCHRSVLRDLLIAEGASVAG
jgi:uncharacterized protein YeaO (DUF488 family)